MKTLEGDVMSSGLVNGRGCARSLSWFSCDQGLLSAPVRSSWSPDVESNFSSQLLHSIILGIAIPESIVRLTQHASV